MSLPGSRGPTARCGRWRRRRLQQFWPVYQQNFGHLLTPDLTSAVERTWANMDWVFKRFATPPVTVIHGDYRLDNMFFPEREGDPITVIDFQLMARARGPYDLAYFTSQSLDIEQRRATEHDLVRRYHDTLMAAGVRDYSFDDCFEDYRLAILWCAVFPIGMGGGLAGDSAAPPRAGHGGLAPLLHGDRGPGRGFDSAGLSQAPAVSSAASISPRWASTCMVIDMRTRSDIWISSGMTGSLTGRASVSSSRPAMPLTASS